MAVLALVCLLILAVALGTLGMVAVGMAGLGADRLPRFAARSRAVVDQLDGTAPTPERFVRVASNPRGTLRSLAARTLVELRALAEVTRALLTRAARTTQRRVQLARAQRATRPVGELRAQH